MNTIDSQVEKFREYHEQDKSNLPLLCDLLDLEIQAGYFSEAYTRIQSASKIWNNSPELSFRLATLHIASGEAQKASLILEDMIESGIDNEVVKYNLAYAYMYLGKYDAVKSVLAYVTTGHVQLHEAKLLYSRALHHTGDLEQAIKFACEFVESYSENAEALGMLSLMYFDLQDDEHAKHYAEAAIRYDQINKDALVTLGSISLGDQQFASAKQYFSTATEKHPNSGRAWSGLGLSFMMEQNLDEAIDALNKSVLNMPSHLGTWQALAWCQIVSGKVDDAETSLISAMEIDHNFGETHGGLAVVKAIQGLNEEAERLVKIASKLDPSSFSAKFASSLLKQKTDPEASAKIINEILAVPVGKNNQKLSDQLQIILRHKKQD